MTESILLVTDDNLEEARASISAIDLRDEVEVGVTIRHYLSDGVELVAYVEEERGGISRGGDSAWGDWDDESGRLTLDELDGDYCPIVLDPSGDRLDPPVCHIRRTRYEDDSSTCLANCYCGVSAYEAEIATNYDSYDRWIGRGIPMACAPVCAACEAAIEAGDED